MMLASHCIFNKLQISFQDGIKDHKLAKDQAIEPEKTQARSTGTIVTKQAEKTEVRHEVNHNDEFRRVFVNYITRAITEANHSSLLTAKLRRHNLQWLREFQTEHKKTLGVDRFISL